MTRKVRRSDAKATASTTRPSIIHVTSKRWGDRAVCGRHRDFMREGHVLATSVAKGNPDICLTCETLVGFDTMMAALDKAFR